MAKILNENKTIGHICICVCERDREFKIWLKIFYEQYILYSLSMWIIFC